MINVILPNLAVLLLVSFTMYQLTRSIRRKDGYAPLHLLFFNPSYDTKLSRYLLWMENKFSNRYEFIYINVRLCVYIWI